ncbi:hypothetical protein POJ06DRAFT_90545 [Lipomyces tetrasporus]|uniref:Uncharacterized protein n=1 Tax=Lipomyces tetrasporus TaxID=54092 RepID=A0AAD7VTP2_9ASCO|nr:uncharacterized protein POJ06DRAFT_90545 [Lipomyces tetrasporus]KAJ8101186.1 hypothetical protein POJ06DRAFT_90545 [Lipomyces tetrasporus]
MDGHSQLNSPSSVSPLSLSSGVSNSYFRQGMMNPGSHPPSQSSDRRWYSWFTSLKIRRRLKRTMRSVLLVCVVFALIFAIGQYWRNFDRDSIAIFSDRLTDHSASATPTTTNTDKPQAQPDGNDSSKTESDKIADLRNAERPKFEAELEMTRQLAAHPTPLSLLRYCSNSRYKQSSANFLVSAVVDEGTVARMDFGRNPQAPRYNPNILPFPKDYRHPYIGFARQSPRNVLFHHEIVWCEMDWAETPVIGRKILACVGTPKRLKLDEWITKAGLCRTHKYLGLKQGHADPRILFSPLGEPLMVVGTNGLSNCMNQFVIDLRIVIPGLSTKMKLYGVPIRFKKLTELPRPDYNEIEKNWFLMWDESGIEYVQHETEDRSISAVALPHDKQINIATPGDQKCVTSLKRRLGRKGQANNIHQATNSLRVTLCDFPCIPTIHNTVIIELMHMKYMNRLELFYRRYAVIMNATAPFDIIGRTGNLMYAGTDENVMLYTVSMAWDHEHYRQHEDWNETVHGGHWFFDEVEERERKIAEEMSRTLNVENANEEQGQTTTEEKRETLRKRATPADDMDVEIDDLDTSAASTSVATALSTSAVTVTRLSASSLGTSLTTSASSTTSSAASHSSTSRGTEGKAAELKTTNSLPKSQSYPQNPLVNKYYHGWLDDMIMISVGINDEDSGVLHVRARDMLECVHICKD